MTKSVSKEDLRKMMQKLKAKSGSAVSNNPNLRKYKISAREQALIEEQKRKEAQQREKEKPKPLPEGFFDAKPVKSILKNNKSQTNSAIPQVPANAVDFQADKTVDESRKRTKSRDEASSPPVKKMVDLINATINYKNCTVDPPTHDKIPEEFSASLPEGFFDDPKMDAKARNVEYKNPEEEEWEKFQKEINQEIDLAQDLVTEDQQESTIERQIGEVDEQLQAWSRVSKLEKRLDAIEEKVTEAKQKSDETAESSEDSSDEELTEDQLLNWRTKS